MDPKGNLSSREAENHPSKVTVEVFSSGLENLPHQGSEHVSLGQEEKRVRPLEQALTLEVSRLARQLDALRLQIGEREQQFFKLDHDFENFCRTDETLWDIAEPLPRAPLDRRTKALRGLKTILRNRRSLYRHYSGTAALIACVVMPGLVTWYGLTLIGPKSSVARLAPDAKEIVYQPSVSQADSKVTAQVTYPNLIPSAPISSTQSATIAPTPTQNASAVLPVDNPSTLTPPPQPTIAPVQPKRSIREYEQAIYYALIDRNLAEFNTALEQAYEIDPSFHNLKDVRLIYKSLKQSRISEAQLLRTLQLKVIKESQRWLTPEQLQQLQNQV
jgi:hypothetical protein